MGNYLQWQRPIQDEDQSYFDYVEISRASSQAGSYSVLTSVVIADTDYYDQTGGATDWYKLRFKNNGAGTYSAYTDEFQAGTQNIYCGMREAMDIAGLNTTTLPGNLTWDTIQSACQDASMEVDGITKTIWGRTDSFTKYFDSNTLSLGRFLQLDLRNATITEIALQYSDGTWSVLTSGISGDYEVDGDKGRAYFHWPLSKNQFSGYRDIRVTGTYGNTVVSDPVRTLTKYLAALRIISMLTGGSYSSVQSYSMGKVTYNVGNQTVNLQAAAERIGNEAKSMAQRNGLSLERSHVRVH